MKILVAVDLADTTEQVIVKALDLALASSATVWLLHVAQPEPDFVGYDVDNIPWKTKMPGFKEFELGDVDGCHVSMFWSAC